MRKKPSAEEVFYDRVHRLIKNLIVDNVNNHNNYFCEQSKTEFRDDVRERGKYILEELERMKHMIVDDGEVTER